MTTANIDWLDSGYFYRDKSGAWKYKQGTPFYLVKQFKIFMKAQNKLYENGMRK